MHQKEQGVVPTTDVITMSSRSQNPISSSVRFYVTIKRFAMNTFAKKIKASIVMTSVVGCHGDPTSDS